MREYLVVFLIGFVVLASGCASQQSENPENDTVRDEVNESQQVENNSDVGSGSESVSTDSEGGVPVFKYVDASSKGVPDRVYGSDVNFSEEDELGVKVENMGGDTGSFTVTLNFSNKETGDYFIRNVSSSDLGPGVSEWVNTSVELGLMDRWNVYLQRRDIKERKWRYDVKPPTVGVGEEVSTDRLSVSLNGIEYWDSYKYMEDGEEYTDESGEYESFVVLEYTLKNNFDEPVTVPAENRFNYDLDESYSVEENPGFEKLEFGEGLGPGESTTGKVVFKESASESRHIPEEVQLQYDKQSFNAIWNITQEQWPEGIEITEE